MLAKLSCILHGHTWRTLKMKFINFDRADLSHVEVVERCDVCGRSRAYMRWGDGLQAKRSVVIMLHRHNAADLILPGDV